MRDQNEEEEVEERERRCFVFVLCGKREREVAREGSCDRNGRRARSAQFTLEVEK
jgi:hypothetical protein